MEALKDGNLQLLFSLIDEAAGSGSGKEFDLNNAYPEDKFKTLLHVAIELDDVTSVQKLLSAGANPNLPNRTTNVAPIHVACKNCNVDIFRLLLKAKADANAQTPAGKTALHLITKKSIESDSEQPFKCFKLLLENGKNVAIDAKDKTGGQTALYLAASSTGPNYLSVLRMLLAQGADWSLTVADKPIRDVIKSKVSKKDFDFLTELADSALVEGSTINSAIRESLMNLINDAETVDNLDEFKSALDLALVEDMSGHSPGQMTLMQRAAELGLHHHVQALLLKNINPNLAAPGTAPALVLAGKNGNYNVIQVMKKHKESHEKDEATFTTNFAFRDKRTKSSVLHGVLRKPFRDENLLLSRDGRGKHGREIPKMSRDHVSK